MAFNSLMIQLAAELRSQLPDAPSVIELGNQTFKPRGRDLAAIASALSKREQSFDAELLSEIDARTDEQLNASTADYYRAIGYSSYRSIDVNAKYNSLVMDLNRDLAKDYGFNEAFDLVTNNGTGEHVFNQSAVFANMHALCRVGGVMLHVLPFFNFLNHGFFGYNPILFHDLAAANRYEIRRLSIASGRGIEVGDWPTASGATVLSKDELQERCSVDGSLRGSIRYVLRLGRARKREWRPLSAALRRVMAAGPNVCVVAALRKSIEQPFQFPIQGMYAGANIDDADLRASYAHNSGGTR